AVGKMVGGPAKVAVVASSLFGNISGSAAANVYGTGTFTIPMMKKIGYEPKFAGAVEAAASTGGQIMPPIMGAAAFIMAEFIGIPYARIMVAAIIPAILYYVAVYYAVHAEAVKRGLRGLERTEPFRVILKRSFHMFLPIVAIVYLLLSGYTLYRAAFIAIILAVVVCSYNMISSGNATIKDKVFVWTILSISALTLFSDLLKDFLYVFKFMNIYQTYIFLILVAITIALAHFRREVLMDLKAFFDTMVLGAKNAIMIATACGLAGIIVGTFELTGLGSRLALTISTLLKDYPLVLLVMVAILAIILGMGMPTTAAYIISAIMLAPILVRAGLVEPLIAAGVPTKEALLVIHFFIFYYATLSAITPPVSLAAYAGAAIAGAKIVDVAILAMRLAFVAYLVPIYIVFEPGILMVGSPDEIIIHTISGLIGVILLSATFSGWFFGRINFVQRCIAFIAGGLAILPMYVRESIIIGLIVMAYFIGINKLKRKDGNKNIVLK
ncbi:MAG: TRAP transporter fused permease subunit, partial [Nitrososphaerota archaeon]|nr:TRAP transporter fused permease subunit [Nitrososphaerota archaeon]